MKQFILVFLLFTWRTGFSQDVVLKTLSGKPADSKTCILDIDNLVSVSQIDSLHNEIKKPEILRLTDYLSACKDNNFQFAHDFKDNAFQLVVPGYLSHISYELGNQKFGIVLSDAQDDRCILFSYDLDDSYKKYFFSKTYENFKNAKLIALNGQKLYTFINWDGRNGGKIFSSNHLSISYFTKSKEFVTELQNTISKFKW